MASLEAVVEDVRAWYAMYLAAFKAVCGEERADPRLWIAYFTAPLTVATDTGYAVLPDEDAVYRRQLAAVEQVRASNYDHTETLRLDVDALNTRAALIKGEFSRHDRKGNQFARFKTAYLAVKTDDGWRFSASIGIAE